jgi:hypothetical protein
MPIDKGCGGSKFLLKRNLELLLITFFYTYKFIAPCGNFCG